MQFTLQSQLPPWSQEGLSIRRNSYKVACDLNICLLETSSSDSFSNKHGFRLCARSTSKPTLFLDPAQRGEGGGPLSLPQHRQENGEEQTKTNTPADPFGFCLRVSCTFVGSDFCCRFLPALARQWGVYPSHSWLLCSGEQNWSLCFFISKTLPEAREFTSDSELPQSLRTCRSSSQPPSQIHIQYNLDPLPASQFFREIT